ncbi:hypothetical protein MMC26_001741 [Xylographa opegraphella]|nr:hypothetical protein [Xylographa opegraphella]
MGAVSSCLGGRKTEPEDAETSRLLSDDPYRAQYGSHIQNIQRLVYQPNPESVKREREALENICHAMSDNVIDVFTIQPQTSYQNQSFSESSTGLKTVPHGGTPSDASDEMRQMMLRTIKKGRGGPIVTTLGRGAVASRAVQEAIG